MCENRTVVPPKYRHKRRAQSFFFQRKTLTDNRCCSLAIFFTLTVRAIRGTCERKICQVKRMEGIDTHRKALTAW